MIEEKFSQKFDNLGIFYCPGGLNYEKMNTASKIAMKMFVKMLDSKKNKTENMFEFLFEIYCIFRWGLV